MPLTCLILGSLLLGESEFTKLRNEFDADIVSLQRLYVQSNNDLSKVKPLNDRIVQRQIQSTLPRILKLAKGEKRPQEKIDAFLLALEIANRIESSQPNADVLHGVWDQMVRDTKSYPQFANGLVKARTTLANSTSSQGFFTKILTGNFPPNVKAAVMYGDSMILGGPNATNESNNILQKTSKLFSQTEYGEKAKETLALRAKLKPGLPVPKLIFREVGGNTIDISQQKGRVVVVDFWGFWCPGCVQELSELKALRAKFSEEKLMMVSVSTDSLPDAYFKERTQKAGLSWLQANVRNPYAEEVTKLGIFVYPAKLVVDANGKIEVCGANYQEPDWMEKVEKLLQ
jgi:peroxiredoxin